MAQDFNGTVLATEALQAALDGYQTLQVSRTAAKLEARFQRADGGSHDVDFSELSDGQRQLCALYFLRHAVVQPGRLVMFDAQFGSWRLHRSLVVAGQIGPEENTWREHPHGDLLPILERTDLDGILQAIPGLAAVAGLYGEERSQAIDARVDC